MEDESPRVANLLKFISNHFILKLKKKLKLGMLLAEYYYINFALISFAENCDVLQFYDPISAMHMLSSLHDVQTWLHTINFSSGFSTTTAVNTPKLATSFINILCKCHLPERWRRPWSVTCVWWKLRLLSEGWFLR